MSAWIGFCDRHPRATWLVAFALLFAGLVVWRFEILDSPPYWDSAMGLFLEASFLADNHFDYQALFMEEKRFIEGGSGIYLTSFLPTLVAVLMTLLPTPEATFVAYRLFNLACAVVVLLIVYAIAAPRVGRPAAAMICAVLVTTPVFAVQLDMLGMDLPTTAIALIAALLLLRDRFIAAALVSLVAFFAKLTGALLTAAGLVYLSVRLAVGWNRFGIGMRRHYLIGLAAHLAVLATQLMVIVATTRLPQSELEDYDTDTWLGFLSLAQFAYLSPDVVLLLAATLVAFVLVLLTSWYRASHAPAAIPRSRRVWEALQTTILDEPVALLGWTVVAGMLAALVLTYVIPRYLILPLPFLLLIGGLLLFRSARWRRPALAVAGLLVLFNVANLDGRFFPSFPAEYPFDHRTGALLERSREYLIDHRANIKAVERLVEECAGVPIIAPNPFVHFLSLPRLGYVHEPLEGYAVNTYTNEAFPPIEKLREKALEPHGGLDTEPVFVWTENRFVPIARARLPKPSEADHIIYRDESPQFSPFSLAVFRPRLPGDVPPDALADYLIRQLWPTDEMVAAAQALVEQDKLDEAFTLFQEAVRLNPARTEARFQLAALLAFGGELEAAANEYRQLLARDDRIPDAHRNLAQILIEQGALDEAIEHWKAAVAQRADFHDARHELGVALLRRGDYAAAEAQLRQVVEARPDNLGTAFFLGVALRALGRDEDARQQFENVIAAAPDHAAARFELGRLELADGHATAGIAQLRRAVELEPTWIEPANHLAWVLATHPDAEVRDGAEAVRLAEQFAGDQRSAEPRLLDTLAAAYAESGRYDDAVRTLEQAINQARDAGRKDEADRYETRLPLYQSGQPYQEPPSAVQGVPLSNEASSPNG